MDPLNWKLKLPPDHLETGRGSDRFGLEGFTLIFKKSGGCYIKQMGLM